MIKLWYTLISSRVFLCILLIFSLAGIIILDYFFSSLLKDSFQKTHISDIPSDTYSVQNQSPLPIIPSEPPIPSFVSSETSSLLPLIHEPPLFTTVSKEDHQLPKISYSVSLEDLLSEQIGKKIIVSESKSEAFLFGKIPLTLDQPFLRALSTQYFTQDTKGLEQVLKIYTFSGENSDEIYTQLLEKSHNFLENDIESHIINLETWGKKSFVIKLESNQKFMYLVVALDNMVVGITYPLGINFSSHSQISPVLQRFFRSSSV